MPNTSPAQYKGEFLLINTGKWRLKGTLTSYAKSGTGGSASGTGTLYWWNQALNNGLGGWQLSQTGVAFSASFSAGGKSSYGTFGIIINHAVVPPEPSSLPNTSSVPLKGGNISVS